MDDDTKRMRQIKNENQKNLEEEKIRQEIFIQERIKERKTLDLMFKIWIAFIVIVIFLYMATLIISINKK